MCLISAQFSVQWIFDVISARHRPFKCQAQPFPSKNWKRNNSCSNRTIVRGKRNVSIAKRWYWCVQFQTFMKLMQCLVNTVNSSVSETRIDCEQKACLYHDIKFTSIVIINIWLLAVTDVRNCQIDIVLVKAHILFAVFLAFLIKPISLEILEIGPCSWFS